jgi:hypothetical protein
LLLLIESAEEHVDLREREDARGFVDVVFTRRVKFTKEFDSVYSVLGK